MSRYVVLALTTVVVVALLAGTALAHVTISPREAPSGAYFYAEFSVGHGCDGSPTTAISVQVPDGVTSVKPEVEPGWEIATVVGELGEPVELHGETITEGVTGVTWRGGPLADEHLTRFGMSMKLPERDAGETLWFPVVQECEEGETRWIRIPVEGEDEPDEPAPGLVLTAAEGDGHGDAATAADATAAVDADDAELASAAAPADDSGTDVLPLAALVVGTLGLVVGGAALAARRRTA